MNKEIINPNGVITPPSPFNHIVKAGNFIFLSSQLSADLKLHKILGGSIREQTKQALENIKFLLESAGSSMDNVVKIVVYMKDVKNDFNAMNEIYRKYFKKGEEPARVTVQALSPIESIDIEIEATAIISNETSRVCDEIKRKAHYADKFMVLAINEARKSEKMGGIPVGCVLVKDEEIISQDYNRRVQEGNPLYHAEICCLEKALKKSRNLEGCVLYTTNMPCYLCSGAIVQFGVSKVVAGESKSFPHARELLEQNKIEVVDLNLKECKETVAEFIRKNNGLWNNFPPKNCPK